MLILLFTALAALQSPAATQITLAPEVRAHIDLGSMKGSHVGQLAWSLDGTELYLQTYNEDGKGLQSDTFHYVVPAAGGQPKQVAAQPDWASAYWAWKSGKASPDDSSFAIELEVENTLSAATALPMGGDLARGGVDPTGTTGASMDAMLDAARQSQPQNIYRMRLKGEVVGEWINHRIMPGLTFGWGPQGSGLIAYADKPAGRLVLMDKAGHKQRVDETKDVLLPAWSADLARLAYLQSEGHNTYALVVATVTR